MKFKLGQIIATNSIWEKMNDDAGFYNFVKDSLVRFAQGDWGILCDEDKSASDEAVTNGEMIMGVYAQNDSEIWIITEWDRSVTTVLFPYER